MMTDKEGEELELRWLKEKRSKGLGTAFRVKIKNEECEIPLLKLLAKRKGNYPIICKRPRDFDDPIEYLISSLDGAFLTLYCVDDEPSGLHIDVAKPEDLRDFGLSNHHKAHAP